MFGPARFPFLYWHILLVLAGFVSWCCESDPFAPSDPPAVVTPQVSNAVAEAFADPGPLKLAQFRKALLDSAEDACRNKEITRSQLRTLRLATLNKHFLLKAHQGIAEEVIADSNGAIADATKIDWPKVLDTLKQWLPTILQILSLFLTNAPV